MSEKLFSALSSPCGPAALQPHGGAAIATSRFLTRVPPLIILGSLVVVLGYVSLWQDDLRSIMAAFKDVANMPNVIGAVDGTHIRMLAPSEEEWAVRDVNIDRCFELLFRRLDPRKRPLTKSTVVFSGQMRWGVAPSISVDRFFLMRREERFQQGHLAPNFAVHLSQHQIGRPTWVDLFVPYFGTDIDEIANFIVVPVSE